MKDSLSKGIVIVKNDVDYIIIIWVKLNKTVCGFEIGVYICSLVAPPENIHIIYFAHDQLADEIMLFQENGSFSWSPETSIDEQEKRVIVMRMTMTWIIITY